ncbi:hypothetical protein FRB90_000960 [Tulasnella sp. 427]|nr:hypothetical protein FRB90_000960 [Tulasnella sp. 427]
MTAARSIIRALCCRQVAVDSTAEDPSDLDRWLEAEARERSFRVYDLKRQGIPSPFDRQTEVKAEPIYGHPSAVWPAPTTDLKLNPLLTHTSSFSSCGPIRWNIVNDPYAAEITDPTLRPSRETLFNQPATCHPVQKIRLLITIPRLVMTIGLPIVDPSGITTSTILTRLHVWLLQPVDQTQWSSKFTERGRQAVMKQQRWNRRMFGALLPLSEVLNLDCLDGRHFFKGLHAQSKIGVSAEALEGWERDDWENEGWPAYHTKVYFVLLEQTPYG